MSSTRRTKRGSKRFASVEEAAEHNVLRMTREQAERELHWLEMQDDQPFVRQALIRALHRRVASFQDRNQP